MAEIDRIAEAAEAINAAHMRYCIALVENEQRHGHAFGPWPWQADPFERNYGIGRNPPAVDVTLELLDDMLASVPLEHAVVRAAAVVMNAQKAAATRPMEHPHWGIESRRYWLPGVR